MEQLQGWLGISEYWSSRISLCGQLERTERELQRSHVALGNAQEEIAVLQKELAESREALAALKTAKEEVDAIRKALWT